VVHCQVLEERLKTVVIDHDAAQKQRQEEVDKLHLFLNFLWFYSHLVVWNFKKSLIAFNNEKKYITV